MKSFTKLLTTNFILLLLLWSGSEVNAQFCGSTASPSVSLTVQTFVQTTSTFNSNRRVFTFAAISGNLYTFSTCGTADGDTKLRIYATAAGGTLLAESEDECSGGDDRLMWNAPANGTYSVLLTRANCNTLFQNAAMSYVMTTTTSPCLSIPTITCGTSITSALSAIGQYSLTSCDGNENTPGQELIYSYTPTITGSHTINITSNSGTSDYVNFFYKEASLGCNNSGWQCIGNDAENGNGSLGPVILTGGVTYYIMVDRENTSSITGTSTKVWNISCPIPTPCSVIITIPNTCPNSPTQSVTLSGTGQHNASLCSNTVGGLEQIYSYTPTVTGMYELNVTSTNSSSDNNYGWKLASAGCSDGGWTCISNDVDDPLTDLFGPLTAGVPIYIIVDAEGTGSRTHQFNIECAVVTPANDLCSGAIAIACGSSYTGTTAGANDESGLPACGATGSGTFNNGVWHSVTLPTSGTINISLCGTTWDTYLRLFSGSCASLVCVASDNDGCGQQSVITSAPLPAGTYLVLVSGDGTSELGPYTLTVNCTLCPAAPSGGITSGPATGCSGGTFNYSVSGHTGSIQWQLATGVSPGAYSDIPGANSSTLVYSAASANTYHFRVKASGAGCIDGFSNVTSTVVINSGVILTAQTSSPSPLCEGSSITLLGNTVGGSCNTVPGFSASFAPATWTFSNNPAVIGAGTPGSVNTGGAPGSVSITGIAFGDQTNQSSYMHPITCTGTVTFNWNYSTSHPASLQTLFFLLDIPRFTTDGGASWNVLPGFSTLFGAANQSGSASINVNAGTTFGIQMWSTNGLDGSATVTVSSATFPVNPNVVLTNYNWTGPGFSASVQNPILNVTSASAGTYTVSGIAPSGCSVSSSITIGTKPAPVPQLGSNTDAVCENDIIVLTAFDGTSYNWTGPASYNVNTTGTVAGGSSVTRFNLQEIHEGNYTVTVTGTNGCTKSETKYITVNDRPELFLVTSSPVGCVGDNTGSFEVGVNGGTAPYNFSESTTFQTNGSGIFEALFDGNYSVTVTDDATPSCASVLSLPVTISTVPNVAPALLTAAANTIVECDGSGNLVELNAWMTDNGGATVFDSCGIISWSDNLTTLSNGCGETGSATVTFTATDEGNLTTSSTATFTIVDTSPPSITAAADLIVECNGLGNNNARNAWLASNGGATASDICSGVTWTNNYTAISDLCGQTGSALVTFTATDDCGNSSTTTATFTIVDTNAPVITAASSSTVECDGIGNTTELSTWIANHGGATASDVCSGSVTWSDNFSGFSDLCGNTGSAIVTFTATDDCGNSSYTTAPFNISDTTPPSITAASNSTVECNGVGNNNALNAWLTGNGGATASDICSSNITWSHDFTSLSNLCGATGSAVVTFTASDDCGNATSTTATFTIADTTPPSITAASNSTQECDGAGNLIALNDWLNSNGGATASDVCSGSVSWSNDYTVLSDLCGNNGSATVTFTATDDCGNSSSSTATFTIVDTTPPSITSASSTSVECDGGGNFAELTNWLNINGGASASDICSGSVNWTNDYLSLSDLCGNTGSSTVTFTATDDCGNSSTTTAIFTIVDTTAPTITAASGSTVQCDGAGNTGALNAWIANHGGATASDACSGISWSDNFSSLSDLCGSTGNATVTFTATDECGNASSSTAVFTIIDTTAPAITTASNSIVECDGAGNTVALNSWLANNGGAMASDICSGVSWSNNYTSLSDLCGATGAATVTFTATDACGNAASSTAIFTIEDNTAPSFICPGDITMNNDLDQCGAIVNYATTASDNCSGTVPVIYSIAPGTFFAVGTNIVNVSATDDCGNVTSCSFNVTVNDNQLPEISIPANINVGNTPNICGAIVNYAAPVASDNCNFSVAQTNGNPSGSTFPIGTTVNIFQVTDASGNTTTASFSVQVNDTQAPYLATGSSNPANFTACNPVSWTPPNYTDNCPGVQVTSSHVPGSDFPIGTTLVTYTATDLVGHTSTSTFNVTVEDTSLAATSITSNRDYNNICLGGNITLTLNGGHLGVGAQWKWYRNGCGASSGGTLVASNVTSITVAPTATTSYYVRAEGGCRTTECVQISVVVSTSTPSATPVYSTLPAFGAPGVTSTLSVNPIPGATFYRWFTNNGHINSVLFDGQLSPHETTVPTTQISFILPQQNYQIRVLAGNACGRTGQSNTHIRGTVSSPGSMSGPTQVCPGVSVVYTIPPVPPVSGNSSVSYQWNLVPSSAGTISVSANGLTATIVFNMGFGTAQVCANGVSSFGLPGTPYCLTVSSSAPVPGAVSGNITPCSGNSYSYNIASVPSAVTYNWTSLISGATVTMAPGGLSASVQFPAGSFSGTVCVTASSTCGTSAPSCLPVTNGTPGDPGDISGPAGGVCAASNINYSLATSNAISYQWAVTGNMSMTGVTTNNSVSVNFLPGFTNGTVSVTAFYSCGSVIKTFDVTGAPVLPVVLPSAVCPNTDLTYFITNAVTGDVYTWLASGDIIDQSCTNVQCSQYYIETGNGGGSYQVYASNACGSVGPVNSGSCRIAAEPMSMEIYPNPTTGLLTVDFSSPIGGQYQITVTDLSGRVVMVEDLKAVSGRNQHQLDLGFANAGFYMIYLKDSKGEIAVQKIAVEQ